MAFLTAVFITGISKPLVLLLTSKADLVLGVAVPMPTFWAVILFATTKKARKKNIFFMMNDWLLVII